jgi:hypothetical protein
LARDSQDETQTDTFGSERAAEPTFESVSFLNDLLDDCSRQGLLSQVDRQILIKFKVDAFSAKEIQVDTSLSESAVHVRVHRIMQRLQAAALAWVPRPATRTNGVGQILPVLPKKTRAAMKDFSLKDSATFLSISKSRRQLSLDSSLTSREGQ